MIRYLLDTSIIVELLRHAPPDLLARIRKCRLYSLAISSITLAELEYGVAASSNPPRKEAALQHVLIPFVILPFEDEAARAYGRIREHLRRKGQPIGAMDLLISAHAVAVGVPLITGNAREFRRVPGLKVEDWS